MKLNKLMIVSIILLAIVTFGAASAAEDVPAGDPAVGESDVGSVPASDVEIETGGDVASPVSASANDVALDDNNASGDSETKLGATEGEVLSANTHVVTPDNFYDYFTTKGKMTNAVQPGDTLDFQGEFIASGSTTYVMIISKPINMISSTKNAYIDMDTHAGSMTGESPGNSFEINSGGSGTNITDIYFHNSQIWFYGAHNINAYNMSVVVEDQQIGSGVGTVALRGGSSNLTFRNCYFYTKNNGGSSTFVLTNASYVTVDHSIIKVEGNVGNMVYFNSYNMELPDGWFMPQLLAAIQKGEITLNDHFTMTNSQIIHPDAATAICIAVTCQISSGYNVFENNIVDYVGSSVSLGQHAVIRNNIIRGSSLSVGADSTVEGNEIYGSTMTVAGAGSTVTGNYIQNTADYAITIPSKAANKENVVTNNYLSAASRTGDAAVNDAGNRNTVQDNQEYQDPVSNIVTQDNFFEFFDDSGFLREEVAFDELIFQGDFSGLTDYVVLDRPIGIVGDEAVLNEMGIVVSASNVYLNDLTLKATSSLGDLVYITGSNVNITGLNIDYATGEESSRAINVYDVKNVIINDTAINYESHVTSDEKEAGAINIEYSDNVDVVNSNIVTSLPALCVTNYDSEDMFMGLNLVNPIRISHSNKVRILKNNITSNNNDYSQEYATIQAFLIKNSDDCLIDGNNISLIDEIAQKDQDIYLYGISFSNDANLVMSNNDFYVHTEGGKYAAGTAYAIQGITSSITFVRNNITTFSNGPNIGIYVTSMSGEDASTIAEFNYINVTGYGAPGNDWALVTGIEIQNGNAYIYNNTIYTYNVGEYDEDNYMYGVSYTQWMYGDRVLDIKDNTIVTEGKYTVYTKPGTEVTVTGNVLYGHDLVGDASVNPNEGEGVLVENNYPAICNNITVTVDDVFDNEPIVVVVNVPGATGTVTIKINNKEYVIDLIDGVATEEISDYGDDRLVNATFNGDLKYYSNWNTTTFKVILGNVVVNDTFFDYFDEDGNLKSIIPYEELIFKGEFSDLGVDVITINRPIDIVGDEAILSDIGFKIISGDVKLANMTLIAEDISFTSNNGAVIFINDVENVTLEKLDIDYSAPSDANAYAIYAKDAVDFNLLDSTVFFDANNVGVQVYQHGIEIRDCEDVLIKGNVIEGTLPSQTADWYGEGINKDYPLLIGIQNGENIVLAENGISIITEPGSGSTATLDGIMADGFKDLTISKNNITHIDFTGDQKAGYVYTIDLYNFEGALIEYNNILVNTTTGVEAAGSAYPIQLTGPFNALVIDNNNLTSSSKGPNLGIFAANYYGGAAEALISNNFINVTGYATADNWALVSGIEFEGTYAGIYNNTIHVQSIAPYADDNSMYGISFAQYGSPGEFDIQNNTIFADGKYAVYLGTAKDSVITENTLYAHDLMGDDAAVALGDNNVVVNNYPGTPSINVKASNVFEGQPTTVTVTVPGATGNVTIRVNNKEYIVDLTEGVAVQEISDYGDDYFVNVTYNGDYRFFPVSNSTTFKLLDNVVVNDTFFDYFDEDGFLKSVVPYDDLIFKGEFSNLPNVNINRELTITGQDAVLENIGFVISSEEVKLDGLTLNANGNLGDLIIVKESDVELCNLNISYVAGDKAANVINVKGLDTLYDVNILNNNIYFSSNVAKDSQVNTAINLEDVEDIIIDGNNITVELPAMNVNSYDWNYFLMGLAYVNPVRIYEGYSVDFTNNNVNVSSNGYRGSYPTIQTLYIVGSDGVLVKGNNFTMRDESIPQETPSYLYVVEAGFSNDVDFIDNNFDIYTTGGKSGAGSAYALQLVSTSSTVRGNNITSDSNGPNLGIYLPMGFGVAKDLLVEENFINITGFAASSSDYALISAIEVQTGYAKIYNNTIFVQNKGDYNEKYPVYGISSAQDGVKTLSFDIKDNSINTNGVYAVEFNNEVNNANVTDNYLIAAGFLGDKSVFIKKGNGNVVKDNYPAFTSEILIDIDTVWIGSDDEIVITVPDFAGKVNIKINGETFSADLNESVAKYTLPASALVGGENTVEVGFIPEGFTGVLATNSTTFRVLDGVITNETYPYYFGEDNYLVDLAPEGAVLDFQGLFVGDYVININKPVNIVSSTGDALFTTGAGNKANLNILAGGDHTNVTGLSFVNYCVFVKGASYVTIDGINAVANERGVGSGTGFVSIHSNAYYTTVKNCYLENGGTGSSVLVLGKGGKYATFDNNTCNVTGSSGNILSSNIFVGTGDNPEFVNYTNNRIISSVGEAATMYGITVCGQGNIIENNTLTNFKGNAIVNQWGATSTKNVYRNNTITGGGSMAVGTYSLVEANTLESTLTVTEGCTASENNVSGLTISGKNVVARDNTVAGAVTINSAAKNTTFTGNNVTGTVTVNSNDNNIEGNWINTTGDYAVDLKTTSNNNVTNNYLVSAKIYGDKAVNYKEENNNIVKNNYPLFDSEIIIEVANVWIGFDNKVVVTVPNATGKVNIKINGETYTVELNESAAEYILPASVLVAGENTVEVEFIPEGFVEVLVTNSTTFMVLDGVITNETYPYYFGEDNYLVDIAPEGAVLDFQGLFVGDYVININKPVNIVSSTGDALFTTGAGNKANLNILAGGDHTNVTGLSFVNYCVFVKGASYVTIDGINAVANQRGVGSGTGFVSIHSNAYYTTVKNCYLENGGTGSSVLVLGKGGKYATFDNNTCNVTGSSGNILSSNVFVGSGDNPEFVNYTNNRIISSVGEAATMYGITVCGQGNIIENNTLTNFKGNAIVNQFGATSTKNVYRNNTITGGGSMAVGTYSLVEANTLESTLTVTEGCTAVENNVYGLTISGKNVVARDNTVAGAVTINSAAKNTTFTGNNVTGTVTVNSNDNNIEGNWINTTGDYAVDLKTTSNNNVTNNYLVSASLYGDAAVKFSGDNIVKDNYPVFDSEIIIEVANVWIGFDNRVVVSVPNATGKVNIKINGETYSVELNESVAEYILPASVLVAGENTIEVDYIPEGGSGALANNSTTFRVLDGVITNETYPYYFGEDNYLVDIAPEGAVLDFQGLFVGDYVININKPVNIVSSTGDALFTTGAGNKANLNILAGGDHTNVTGLSFVNYCVFVKGASYVTIDGINAVANQRGVGSGTGFVSIHSNAYYTTVKNCYLENGGTGSSVLVLGKGGKYATFDNNTCNVTGSSGNILSSNVFVGSGDNPEFVNYTNNRIISSVAGSSTMYGITVCGQGNIIENNTLTNFKGNAIVNQFGATSTKNVYRNNTITGGGSMAVGTYSLVEANTLESTLTVTEGCTAVENNVYGLTISGKNVVARDNTVAGAVTINSAATNTTFTGNDVTGTVTVKSNNNVIKENRINSTGEYAVDLTTKTGNEVTDNWLYSSSLYGDAAVKFSGDNVVKDNLPYKPNLTVSVDNITVGEDAVINVKLDAAAIGTVIVNVNGQLLDVEINDGEGSVSISGLFASDYTVTASFIPGGAEFGGDEVSTVFNVAKVKNNLTITVPESINPGDSPVIDIALGNVNATVTVLINGKEETVNLIDGKGNVTIENITAGDYSIVARYDGDKNNEPAFDSTSFSIAKIRNDLIISVPDTIMAGDSPVIDIALGNVNGTLTVIVDGKKQSVEIIDGKANVTIENITAGSHSIVAIFDGDVNNEPAFASASLSANKTATNIVLEIEDGLMYGDSTVIKAYINATGNVVFFISGASESVPIIDGVASLEITGLSAGDFAVDAIYFESDLYLASNASGIMKVAKWNSTISASAEPIQVGENATVVVVLPSDATGKVTINDKFIGEVIDGVANVVVSGLTQNATLTVVFEGDEKYNGNETTVDVEVSKVSDYNMTVTGSSNDGKTIVDVELPEDANGNVTVTTPNGNTTVPVEDGKATVVIPDLPVGENTVEVTYSGDIKYNPQSTEQTVNTTKRDSILSAGKLEMIVGDGSKFTVNLTDSEGNPIANRGIKFIIVGKTYVVKTDKNGIASLPINLKAGSYPITVIFDGDSTYNPSNAVVTSVEVYTNSRITGNKDLVKTEGGSEKFTVRALDKYGKPVGAYAKVKMTISGKTYTVNTDANGYASLPINLKAGTYQITTEYGGTKVTNKVTVKKK